MIEEFEKIVERLLEGATPTDDGRWWQLNTPLRLRISVEAEAAGERVTLTTNALTPTHLSPDKAGVWFKEIPGCWPIFLWPKWAIRLVEKEGQK